MKQYLRKYNPIVSIANAAPKDTRDGNNEHNQHKGDKDDQWSEIIQNG